MALIGSGWKRIIRIKGIVISYKLTVNRQQINTTHTLPRPRLAPRSLKVFSMLV